MGALPDISDMAAEIMIFGTSKRIKDETSFFAWVGKEVLGEAISEVAGSVAEMTAEAGLGAVNSLAKPLAAMPASVFVLQYQQKLYAIRGDAGYAKEVGISCSAFSCNCSNKQVRYPKFENGRSPYDCRDLILKLAELLDNNIAKIAVSSFVAPIKDVASGGIEALSYMAGPIINNASNVMFGQESGNTDFTGITEQIGEQSSSAMDSAEEQALNALWGSCEDDVKAVAASLWLMARPKAVKLGSASHTVQRPGCERAQAVIALIFRELKLPDISSKASDYRQTITGIASPNGPKAIASSIYDQVNKLF